MFGVFLKLDIQPDENRCFVLMPFEEKFDAIYRLIQRCCTEQEIDCQRADEDARPGKITSQIYELISKSGIIIADMTGRNPNVFYELGLAHAISSNVILLTQSIDDVPFDLRDFTHIRYENTFSGAEKLSVELSKALTAIIRSSGTIAKTADTAKLVDSKDIQVDETDIDMMHLQAELARDNRNLSEAEIWLKKALKEAERGGGSVGAVGNCAIEAELCGFYDMAEALFKLALDRDPSHINICQSYVSFLLDHRSTNAEKMNTASQILDDLEKHPERRERTRALRAQFLILAQGRGQISAIIDETLENQEFSSLEEASAVLMLLARSKEHDKLQSLISDLRDKVAPGEILLLDRILADAYASSGSNELEQEAIAIYTELEKTEADPQVKHNLATLIFSNDRTGRDPRIDPLWSAAYGELSHDINVRKAYGQFLLRVGRKEDAEKVLTGTPLK